MIAGMRQLIQRTNMVSKEVSENAENVTQNSTLLLQATEEITRSVEEIEEGASLQAIDAQGCLT